MRIPVSAAVSGLGAPKLRLTITNLGPGGLTQTVTLDGAGALPTEPSVAGAYFYRLTGDKLTAGTYKLTAELDAENALSNDPKSDNVITDSFVVSPAVNLVVNTGAIRQFVDHLTPAPTLPADADLRAALLAGLPVSSVTIKPYPIPLQAFMSGEMGGADLAGANVASFWGNAKYGLTVADMEAQMLRGQVYLGWYDGFTTAAINNRYYQTVTINSKTADWRAAAVNGVLRVTDNNATLSGCPTLSTVAVDAAAMTLRSDAVDVLGSGCAANAVRRPSAHALKIWYTQWSTGQVAPNNGVSAEGYISGFDDALPEGFAAATGNDLVTIAKTSDGMVLSLPADTGSVNLAVNFIDASGKVWTSKGTYLQIYYGALLDPTDHSRVVLPIARSNAAGQWSIHGHADAKGTTYKDIKMRVPNP